MRRCQYTAQPSVPVGGDDGANGRQCSLEGGVGTYGELLVCSARPHHHDLQSVRVRDHRPVAERRWGYTILMLLPRKRGLATGSPGDSGMLTSYNIICTSPTKQTHPLNLHTAVPLG
jgi:hypothetical protein